MEGLSTPIGSPVGSGWSIFRQILRGLRATVTIKKRVDVDFTPTKKERREIEISIDIGAKE
jgi:hypothetical protein